MTRNHRQTPTDIRPPMRRRFDYRPNILASFWQAVQNLAWSARMGFWGAIDLFFALLLPALMIAIVVLSVYVLWNLYF